MSDTLLKDGIADDHIIFDNKVSITVEHNVRNKTTSGVNFTTGTFEAGVVIFTVDNCLFRGLNYRTVGTTKQIQERMAAVQKDEIPKIDSVVEVPCDSLDTVRNIIAGDKITNNETGELWRVVSVDLVTLLNRLRIGVSRYG